MNNSGKWFVETLHSDVAVILEIERVLYSGETKYQKVEVLESSSFGRGLVLDGKTQSTERDEHIYHESLVHPAMLAHPNPVTVFIGGGGEGGTLREVLAHRSLERVVMMDLDKEVVDLCRRYLPQHHRGSFDDERLALHHKDAREYLTSCDERFDVIIMDLVDPLEGGSAYLLYTAEFYQIVRSKMAPGGILVTQSGPAGLLSFNECFTTIYHTLSETFKHTAAYQAHVPCFQTLWGFTMASDSPFLKLTDVDVDTRVQDRINHELGFYDGETHRNMFALPKFLRNGIQKEQNINRDSTPVFML
jgi:spermidine synthase